jgi:type I restriction enzyme R subunit
MYVDKRLSGVQAVQTLSRLNRTHPGKDAVFVLDFVNDPEEILSSFRPYYRKAELSDVSDPNQVHDLLRKIKETGIVEDAEITKCSDVAYARGAKQADLLKALAPAVYRFDARWKAASALAASADPAEAKEGKEAQDGLLLAKSDMGSFLRLYDFLSQIFDYEDTDLERSAITLRLLLPLLHAERSRESVDLKGMVLTHHALRDRGTRELRLGAPSPDGDDGRLDPGSPGGGKVRESEKAALGEVISKVNDLFEGEDLTDADKVSYVRHLRDRMLENPVLERQAGANTKEQFSDSPDFKDALTDAIVGAFESHRAMSERAMRSDSVRDGLASLLIDMVWQGFEASRNGKERPSL